MAEFLAVFFIGTFAITGAAWWIAKRITEWWLDE
jgi:hypothetical protein